MSKKFENMLEKIKRVKFLEEEARKSPNPLSNRAHSELERLMVHDDELSHSAREALDRLIRRQGVIIQRKIRDGGTEKLDTETKKRVVSIDQKIDTKDGEIRQVVETAETEIGQAGAPLFKPEDRVSKKENVELGAIVSIRNQLREIQRHGFNSRKQRELTFIALSDVDLCRERGGEIDAKIEEKLKELLHLIKGDNDNYGNIMSTAKNLDKMLEEDENKLRSTIKEKAA